jgi:hypothetical protein
MGCVLLFSCLKGVRTRGEDNDNHRWLSFPFFTRAMIGRQKKHENNGYVPSFSCMRGANTRGKDDDDLYDCCRFLFFKGTTIMRKKTTRK